MRESGQQEETGFSKPVLSKRYQEESNRDDDRYPCFGAPNSERAIHGRILTLQDECPLL
jgi:hypothetical protein